MPLYRFDIFHNLIELLFIYDIKPEMAAQIAKGKNYLCKSSIWHTTVLSTVSRVIAILPVSLR
jgi:hypothetical protein